MSGFNGGFRQHQIGDNIDDNNPFKRGTAVEIMPNMDKKRIRGAGDRLFQCAVEPVQSVDYVISSRFRTRGTLFDFTADLGAPLFRPRLITLDSVVLPKLKNMTIQNNRVCVQFIDTFQQPNDLLPFDVEFLLPLLYYTPGVLSEEFSTLFKSAIETKFEDLQIFPGVPGVGVWAREVSAIVTMLFDNDLNQFDLSVVIKYEQWDAPDPGGVMLFPLADQITPFWFVNDCNYISNGDNFAPFPSTDRITVSALNQPPQPSSTLNPPHFIQSGLAGMQFTRYVTINSIAINQYAYADSKVNRTGAGGGSGKIIAVIDTSQTRILTDAFGGSFLPLQSPSAPFISINNPQSQLTQFLDFVVRDEFGNAIDFMFDEFNTIGITFWLKVTF